MLKFCDFNQFGESLNKVQIDRYNSS
jgi:hypothetical protein